MEGLVVAGSLLSVGMGIYGQYQQSKQMQGMFEAMQSQFSQPQANAQNAAQTMPTPPENPQLALEQGGQNTEAEDAGRRQQAIAAAADAAYNPTGGLGIVSSALGGRRTLGAGV